jgi:GT2 family glycosyltransferase
VDGDETTSPPERSRDELIAENQRLRLQLAEARRETHVWRANVQAIAESRAVIVARMMSRSFLKLAPPGSLRRRWSGKLTEGLLWLRRRGEPVPPYSVRRYRQYYAHTVPSTSALRSRTASLTYLELHPVVSVVVATGAGDVERTIESIRAQVYDRCEVLVAGGGRRAGVSGVITVSHKGPAEDRVNAAVKEATGEFVVVLDAGDILSPHAIVDLVAAVQDGSDAAYGDEDRVDEESEHVDWHLKPARFGHETHLSYDVIGSPLLVRTSLFGEVGGLDASTAPAAAYDFALRLVEATDRIHHVGEVLVSKPAALAVGPEEETAAMVPVVTAALKRRGASATVTPGEVLPSVRYVVDPPSPQPSVTIVVPTRDRLDLLRACIESVEKLSTYANYSILICDNDSKEPETLEWFKKSTHTVVACPGPFNYAKIVNRGVAHTDSAFIVTLNNDTTIKTPQWLERLVGLCSLPKVGTVGVKLEYPDGTLQHEGVGIIPLPVHISRDANYAEVDRWLTSTRNAAAVTGACQIVRAEAWRELGGLDERLAVAFNDVDFGMRLVAAGWDVVYTPEVVLGHRESASRGDLHPPADEALLISRWDLLGDYVDPSLPASMRQYTTRIELDIPAPGR